jgi:hypothetical protein
MLPPSLGPKSNPNFLLGLFFGVKNEGDKFCQALADFQQTT